MLTNNKKSIFVKSIAMIMAVLMVLAVCLTGCADKEAQATANEALTTATEAKTAADAVKQALENYLPKTDAVTEAAIKAEIENALAGYAKTDALADFVKSGDLTALSNKLADYVKTASLKAEVEKIVGAYVKPADLTAEVEKLTALITAAGNKADTVKAEITETLKGYVTTAKLDETVAALTNKVTAVEDKVNALDIDGKITTALVTYATKAEVEALGTRLEKLEDVVRAILEAFYTREEIETLEGSAFEDLLDMPAETITTLIKDKMSLTEWNETTPLVIKTIDSIQTMLSKVYKAAGVNEQADAYTKAAKDQINEYLKPLNIVLFDKDYKVTDYNKNAKNLEYTILRVATVAELEALKAAVDNANAVKNFKDELADLNTTYLFTIGDEHTATDPKDLKVQTVTIANKAEINTYVEKYDELIIKYLTDAAGNAFNYNAQYALTYGKQAMMNVWQHPTTGKLVVVDTAKTEYKTTESGKEVVWTKTDIVTILTQNVALDANGVVSATDLVNGDEWKKADSYELIYLPTTIAEFDWANGSTTTAKVDGHYGSNKDLEVAATFKNPEGTLLAVVRQTQDAQDLVNTANKTFADFLAIVKANGTIKDGTQDKALSEITAPTDAQYLEALTVAMCTPVDPDGTDTDGDGVADYKYTLYLLNKVKTDMRAAMARNTCEDTDDAANNHTDALKSAITKYDLYLNMYDKAWDLVFELYRVYAQDMLKVMLQDYISVIDNFKYATTLPAQNVTTLAEESGFRAQYEFQNQISAGFLDAFLGGAKASWSSSAAGDQAAIVIEEDFTNTALVTYYGDTNGKAYTAKDVAVVANPAKTIVDNAEYLNMFLTASVQNIVNNIRLADKATVKGDSKYYNDIDKFFEELLNTAVDNMNEVYNRFLFEDYKADKINETYVFATTITNFFSGSEVAALIEAMEHYLTGYSFTATSAPAEGVTTNKLWANEASLVNASMTTEFAGVVVNKFEMIDGVSDVALTATNEMKNINTKVAAYEAKLENMAIKYNFLTYLDVATINVNRAYLNYMGIDTLTYDMINGLVANRNFADTTITVTKLQMQMGTIELDDFAAKYTDLLTLIANKENVKHLDYLKNGKIPADDGAAYFDNELKKVLSTTTPGYGYVQTDLNNVVKPEAVIGTDAYAFIGTAVVEFDKVVNVNTKYYTKDDQSATENLYK